MASMFLVIVKLFLVWRNTFGVTGAVEYLQSCPPAEKGQDYTLVLKWTLPEGYKHKHLALDRDENSIAKCTFPNTCTDYSDDHKTTLSINDTSRDINITVNLYNVSKYSELKNEIYWYVTYNDGKPIFFCKVHVFERVKNIHCNFNLFDFGLRISCISTSIDYETCCTVHIKYPGTNIMLLREVNTASYMTSRDPKRYTTCSGQVPKQDLVQGYYEVEVAMYPNVTGSNDDKQFTTKLPFRVSLDVPSLKLIDCRDIIEDNTEVACTCERADNSIIKGSMAWFDNSNSQLVTSSGSNVLKFNATRTNYLHNRYYYCEFQSSIGWLNMNSTLPYKPIIIVPIREINCTYDNLQHKLTVTCEASKVFPAAKCYYIIYYNLTEIMISSHGETFNNLDNHQIPKQYKCVCTIYILKDNLISGNYDIVVYIFPNVTGGYKDKNFGISEMYSFSIDKYESLQQCRDTTVILILFGGVLCVIMIAVLHFIHKFCKENAQNNLLRLCAFCTESKNTNTDYNDINEGYIIALHNVYRGDERLDTADEYRLMGDTIQRTTNEEVILEVNDVYETIDEEINIQSPVVETLYNDHLHHVHQTNAV